MSESRHAFYRKYVQSDAQKEKEKERVKKYRQENPSDVLEWNESKRIKQKKKRQDLNLEENREIKEIQLKKARERKKRKRGNLSKSKRKANNRASAAHKRIKRANTPKAKLKKFYKLMNDIDWDDIFTYMKPHEDKYEPFCKFVLNTSDLPKRLKNQKNLLLEFMKLQALNYFCYLKHKDQPWTETNNIKPFQTVKIDSWNYAIPNQTKDIRIQGRNLSNGDYEAGMDFYIEYNRMVSLRTDRKSYENDSGRRYYHTDPNLVVHKNKEEFRYGKYFHYVGRKVKCDELTMQRQSENLRGVDIYSCIEISLNFPPPWDPRFHLYARSTIDPRFCT